MAALWAFIGGIAGLARMVAAGALVWVFATLWLVPHAIDGARAGYVLETRATAAEALATELRRQITGQQTVIDAYQIQYKNSLAKQAEQDAETEKTIALNNQKRVADGRKCDPLSADDLDFLR